jgi:membrane-bound ClpP family serine protease
MIWINITVNSLLRLAMQRTEIVMLEIFWGCLIGGLIFTLITVIFGDLIGGVFDGILDILSLDGYDFIQPMTLVGGVTIFGGMGILLHEYTSLKALFIIIFALVISLFLSVLMYFFYIKPMSHAENSTGYSIMEHVGKLGEVITPIPQDGYGEILLKVGAGITNEIAGSYDGIEIEAGVRVVVVEVEDSVLYVSKFDE